MSDTEGTTTETAENNVGDAHGTGHCSVEIVPAPGLSGTLSAECFEGEPFLHPVDIISDNQNLTVRVKLCIHGDLRYHLCGDLCFQLAWESCGPAAEGKMVKRLPLDPCKDDEDCYYVDFTLEAGDLTADECGTVYCFCVTVSSRQECEDGRVYTGLIHGFCRDICCIMVRPG